MAKVTGPLLSIGARGQIGQSQVYASWRGVAYARRQVIPANPRTAAQTTTRGTFSALDEQWKRMATLSRAPWIAEISRRPLTPRNAIIRANLPVLRGQVDMTPWIGSPGAAAGLPITGLAVAATANAGELEATISSPQEPVGWTLEAVVAHAIRDRDPAVAPVEFVVEGENLTPTPDGDTLLTLTGLTSTVDYVVSAWARWLRPDGGTAYGASLTSGLVQPA